MRSRLSARSHNSSQASGIWVCLAKSLTFLAISRKCSSLIAHRHVPASENAHRGGAELAKPNRRRSCVTFSGINDGRTTTHPAIRYPAIPGAGGNIARQSSAPDRDRRYSTSLLGTRSGQISSTREARQRFPSRTPVKSVSSEHAPSAFGWALRLRPRTITSPASASSPVRRVSARRGAPVIRYPMMPLPRLDGSPPST